MKANHFISFFASYCTPLNNNSRVPGSQTCITDSKLSSLQFEDKDIIKIIRSLNINKAHGHDDISIRMLKICDLAIIKPLSIIFRNCINHSTFSDLQKKSNIYPFHTKGDKQIIINYRPLSLLPICRKIFERLIFRWGTHLYIMSLFLSIRPSVYCAVYLRNRTSSGHNFWYTYVKG